MSKPDTVSTFLIQGVFPKVLTWVSLKWSVSWSFNDVYKCSSLLEWIYNESVISPTDIWSKAEGSLFCLLLLLSLLLDTSGLSRKLLLLFWIVLVIRSLSYETVWMVPETWSKLCHIAELSKLSCVLRSVWASAFSIFYLFEWPLYMNTEPLEL